MLIGENSDENKKRESTKEREKSKHKRHKLRKILKEKLGIEHLNDMKVQCSY